MRISALIGASAALLLAVSPAHALVETEINDSIAMANIVVSPDFASGLRAGSIDADTFRFTGLIPGETYSAEITVTVLGLAWLEENGTILDSDAFNGEGLEVLVVADGNGEALLRVCGHVAGVFDCTGASTGGGPYVLTLPEPRAALLAGVALALLGVLRRPR